MVYNRTRDLELLKGEQSFENLGKVFYREEFENFLKLWKYDAAICKYFYWKNRFQLASLIKQFINGRISGYELKYNCFLLKKKLSKLTNQLRLDLDSEKFEDFNPDFLGLIGFANFISLLDDEFDDFRDDYDKKKFYQSVKNIFLELQKVFNETGEIDLDLNKSEN